MKTAELERFRKRLEAEEQDLLERLREIASTKGRATESEVVMELSGYDDHPADMASETFEKEKDQAMLEGIHHSLARVRNALAKVKRGTYGKCDNCSRQIGLQRLRALPHATLCVECQGRRETR
ncbi:MAG TPA: TraR/DksA C4-type zinc finger protein [Armatimonadota bacterium]|jgi:RNA polymerase-binding protein DksA|nr:TraR/DksA C4-type zinc finger protein [Armatimonadota bacterium]